MKRPPFPAREHEELLRIVRQETPNLIELASRVGRDWLEDEEVEALANVTLNYFLGHQLRPDDEPLPNVGILGDDLSVLIEQQRRSFWDELPPRRLLAAGATKESSSYDAPRASR